MEPESLRFTESFEIQSFIVSVSSSLTLLKKTFVTKSQQNYEKLHIDTLLEDFIVLCSITGKVRNK